MPTRRATKKIIRKPLRFKQREVERAIRGVQKMGLQVGRVEVDPITGKFAIAMAGKPTDTDQQNENESRRWDQRIADVKNKKRSA